MKAALVALSLFFTAPAFATEVTPPTPATTQPTEPPPFTPASPEEPSQASPDLDELMKMLTGDEKKPEPTAECAVRPCVLAYRFSDGVDEDSAEKFTKFMAAARSAKADMVMVEVNTPGGSMSDGHEISRQIENAPFHVVCVVDHMSASMGMYILESCDTRVMSKRSSLMIHQVALIARPGTRLTEVTTANAANTIRVATRAYVEWVAHRMKTPTPEVLQKISGGREWWLDWEEAIQVGAVDKVIEGPPEAYLKQLRQTGKP
jgi:ATP-dependent protease ClpP protease subunit